MGERNTRFAPRQNLGAVPAGKHDGGERTKRTSERKRERGKPVSVAVFFLSTSRVRRKGSKEKERESKREGGSGRQRRHGHRKKMDGGKGATVEKRRMLCHVPCSVSVLK